MLLYNTTCCIIPEHPAPAGTYTIIEQGGEHTLQPLQQAALPALAAWLRSLVASVLDESVSGDAQ